MGGEAGSNSIIPSCTDVADICCGDAAGCGDEGDGDIENELKLEVSNSSRLSTTSEANTENVRASRAMAMLDVVALTVLDDREIG